MESDSNRKIMLKPIFQALLYVAKITPFIIGGLFLAELVIAFRVTDKLSFVTRPITNFGHIPRCCGLSFLTAFASPTAASSMLIGFYKEGKITQKELLVAALVNSFPGSLMHWKWILPAIIPLLKTTGLIYFAAFVVIGFTKTLAVLTIGRVMFPGNDSSFVETIEKAKPQPLKEVMKVSFNNTKKTSIRILRVMLPVTMLVFILIDTGILSRATAYFGGIVKYFPIPAEAVPIVVTQLANNIAAYTFAGNLLSENVITSREVVLSLLVGDIFSFITKLRILIPSYLGIYGPAIGAKLLILTLGLRTIVTILMIFGLNIWW